MKKTRIEVTFNNGKFVAFPNVTKYEYGENNIIGIKFGSVSEEEQHEAYVNMNNVNFIEVMEE